jgi:N-carbamoylputrescine amidase
MSKRFLRVALVQEANQGSADKNLNAIENALTKASAEGAQLVVLQELHNTAYFCQSENVASFNLAESIPGPSTDRLSLLAAKHGVVLVASLFEKRAPGLFHNTAVVFDNDGKLAGKYRKMHIPEDPGFQEKFYFTPGDLGFKPIETSIGRLGVLVCWDQWYPEAARLMTLHGADLLIYPTAIGWDPHDQADEKNRQRDAWVTIQRAHAVANGLPVISVNRVGYEAHPDQLEKGIQFWGHSFVAGPQGELLALAGETNETLICNIDLSRSEDVRRIWPFLRDRRIDAYADLNQRFCDQ